MSKARLQAWWLPMVATVLAGCGGEAGEVSGQACVPGQVQACTCASGEVVQNICPTASVFAECPCLAAPGADGGAGFSGGNGGSASGPGGASGMGGAAGVAGRGGGGGTVDAGAMPDAAMAMAGGGGQVDAASPNPDALVVQPGCKTGLLVSGADTLLNVIVTDAGIIVAQTNLVQLFGRDGAVKKTFTPPRPLTTVSSDGVYVAAADAARLNVLAMDLTFQGDVNLVEACASSVVVKDHVFVCGPENDWDRIFYTYKLPTRQLFATGSRKYTYNGIPMRRVPGTNDFITVTIGTSPSDFNLYRVDQASGDVSHLGESPYHGDFPATLTFGLVNSPSTHILNVDGLLLKIYSDKCQAGTSSFNSGCFVKDGNIGTLAANERFAVIGGDGGGTLYALVNTSTSYFDAACKGGCSLQTIDVASRQVKSRKPQSLEATKFTMLEPDATCKTAVVGYSLPKAGSSFETSGFRVDVLSL